MSNTNLNFNNSKVPKLYRSTHKKCFNNYFCGNNVSEYNHSRCNSCCNPGDREWAYYNRNSVLSPPKLHRSTQHRCVNHSSCIKNVSEYGHNLCWACCRPGDFEWNYHNT